MGGNPYFHENKIRYFENFQCVFGGHFIFMNILPREKKNLCPSIEEWEGHA